MIIVQLKGGLGNQLFQYAAGLSLAKHHKEPVKVDVSGLKQPDEEIGTLRNYELQHLIDPPEIASQHEIDALINANTFVKYLQKLLPSYQRVIFNEKRIEFDDNFFKANKNIYLKGYRQSEKYFLSVANDILTAYQLKPALIGNVAALGTTINKTESVSIHIRRGDYTNRALADYHGIIPEKYYQKAISKAASMIQKPSFYIFSDQIDWVKQHLHFTNPVEFVSGSISKTHYEDFYLMSQCRHNIIANSSFSWWAAWLNRNQKKLVIAPQKWFNDTAQNTKDLIPDRWVRL